MVFASRRDALTGLAAAGVTGLLPGVVGRARAVPAQAGEKLASLVINGMPATPSVVMARLIETGALSRFADKTQLKVWRTPDQMRAGVVSGEMTVFGTPSYSCANMRNRGVPVRLMNIVTWGLLYLMSRDETVQKIEDIAGKTVLMAFRNDAPDLIFRMTLRKLGMNPDTDVKLHYVGAPTEAVQLLLADRAALAVISEPAATAAQIRGAQAGVTVKRTADLTAVYGRLTGRPPRIAQAGLGVREDFLQANPELVRAIHQGCVESARWVLDNPAEAGKLGAATLDLAAPVVEKSIPHFRLDVVSAADAKPDLQHYFAALMEMSPDILGGRLPDDAFYWGPGA